MSTPEWSTWDVAKQRKDGAKGNTEETQMGEQPEYPPGPVGMDRVAWVKHYQIWHRNGVCKAPECPQ